MSLGWLGLGAGTITHIEWGRHSWKSQSDVGQGGGGVEAEQVHGIFVNQNALLRNQLLLKKKMRKGDS